MKAVVGAANGKPALPGGKLIGQKQGSKMSTLTGGGQSGGKPTSASAGPAGPPGIEVFG